MFKTKHLWIIHLLGWVLFMSLPLTIVSHQPGMDLPLLVIRSWWFWLFFLIYASVFYGNLLVLTPQLFLKQRYVAYTTVFVGLLLVMFIAQPFEKLIFRKFQQQQGGGVRPEPPRDEFRIGHPPGPPPGGGPDRMPQRQPTPARAVDFVSLTLFIVAWVVAMAIRISREWRQSERRAILSEAEKAHAELSFFKAQINPHFLFNTLNNIYALAISSSAHTAPSILKLSQMMRYITEEAAENYVPLADELTCLENYVELQKLRLNAKTSLNFEIRGNLDDVKIAPLVLMTFVENAFKYGVSNHRESIIQIAVEVAGQNILFFCQNRIVERRYDMERTGVGIFNTQKRLDLLYAGLYDLDIRDDGDFFTVNLKLAGQ
ncbi:sensor histidine kinase [Dyadobacter sp. CY261]|uniref:sensor histidine kinase n=1 Tax=Dyadobacter sp. CY261 TaxID=2907203 RepID=UPI001F3EF8FE|nr:sensor histidine kinase [Dyadobacter sp. CY261]MCF0071788.1 sensor histidine kinase [Dyadobacter sp. CY261]